jgi:hypothetical protein
MLSLEKPDPTNIYPDHIDIWSLALLRYPTVLRLAFVFSYCINF